jgi:hypothetical protein
MGEPGSDGDSEHTTEKKVIVGSLRNTSEDRWACKVPSCTGGFHRLKDCRLFHKMDPEDRFKPLPGLPDPRPWPNRPILPL